MTWHETIEYIRKRSEYVSLVEQAYFEEDLPLNVERFRQGEEFAETLAIIKKLSSSAKNILEIGAGNGVAAINFALLGYHVTAVEPDDSETIGAGAIRRLAEHYQLKNLEVFQNYAEEIGFEDASFDIVYIRQAMHHAYDLKKFIRESARVLKPSGLFLTIRDHVVFNEEDKQWFLNEHPLHKFYGGENAFSPEEYKQAMIEAGLKVEKEIKFFDSPVNYFPMAPQELEDWRSTYGKNVTASLRKRIGVLSELKPLRALYGSMVNEKEAWKKMEMQIPGRMYSYVCVKN